MMTTEVLHRTDAYTQAFLQLERGAAGPPWLAAWRREAFERFAQTGFPSTKDEEWRYTNLAPLAETRFKPIVGEAPFGLTRERLEPALLPGLDGPLVVFVNGLHAPTLSHARAVPAGVRIQSLATALRDRPNEVEPLLGRTASAQGNPFVALNAAFFADGALIEVPRGVVLEGPIHVVWVTTGAREPHRVHPRSLVLLAENAQATLVESFVALDDAVVFTNPVAEVLLRPGAVLRHHRLAREAPRAFHVGALAVAQERATNFRSFNAAIGGGLVRIDLSVDFRAEGAECNLDGLYVTSGTQHVDNRTRVDHRAPHCTSREFYKGVLDGASSATFYGKVLIHPDAQKSDATQSNKNLLLSDRALANSTPALEIRADDVKAAHGSSTGQLDRDALFYLRSRGIDAETARGVLTYAFARDVVARCESAPVRGLLEEFLFTRLPNGNVVREAFR